MRVHRTTLLDMSAIGSDLPSFEGLRMAFWIGAGGVLRSSPTGRTARYALFCHSPDAEIARNFAFGQPIED